MATATTDGKRTRSGLPTNRPTDPTEFLKPVNAEQIEELPYVDPSKAYRVFLQLGPSCRTRQFGSGKWDIGQPEPGTDEYKPTLHAAIHESDPMMGDQVNGWIAKHNSWLKYNRLKDPRGVLNRMFVVLDVRETTETPVMPQSHIGYIPVALVDTYINQQLEAKFDQLLSERGLVSKPQS